MSIRYEPSHLFELSNHGKWIKTGDPSKIKSIIKTEKPKNKDEMKRFLGMMSYYRRFIGDFGTIAACLFEVSRDKIKFNWTEKEDRAYEELKKRLIRSPILIYPDFANKFEIFSDALNDTLGAVLAQKVEGIYHPVAFASRQLNKHERNYSTSEKEMLAIVWAARHFNNDIYGRHITFHTDHRSLSTMTKAKEPNGRLYKLLSKLQELDYEIVYFPGK